MTKYIFCNRGTLLRVSTTDLNYRCYFRIVRDENDDLASDEDSVLSDVDEEGSDDEDGDAAAPNQARLSRCDQVWQLNRYSLYQPGGP